MPVPGSTSASLEQLRQRNKSALAGVSQYLADLGNPWSAAKANPAVPAPNGGLSNDPRIQNKPLTPTQLEQLRAGQNAAISAYTPVAPGLKAPDAYGDPAARARESEQRRMMQQYASKEYWDTEKGKAMLDLGQQSSAPEGAKLADYYEAQRGAGIGAMDEILEGLASVDQRYAAGGDLRKWAEANQALALREYNKRFPSGMPGEGGGEASAPTIDTANPSAGEKALMEAKYALYGAPENESNTNTVPGGYVPDDRVIGMNAQGQTTVGEGAYGFDPAHDQLEIAKPLVEPEAARASNLAPTTQTAQQQKADELLKIFANRTRAAMIGN
jgi:hypothetical protein